MKKLFVVFLIIFSTEKLSAQVSPNSNTAPTSVTGVNTIPAAYSSNMLVNYIRTWIATKPIASDSAVTSNSRTIQEVKQTTEYYDGLGRQLQTVTKKFSPGGRDLVEPKIYDEYGREQFKYMSFVEIDSNIDNGKFKRNPFNEQASFFNNNLFNPGLAGEQVFYHKSIFEASPFSRIDTSFSPGNSWGGSHVGTLDSNLVNIAGDSVRIWVITTTIGVTPTTSGYYMKGMLIKKLTKDENGRRVVEYKDRNGFLILKKIQISETPSNHHTGWLCTYYIYDELSNLRFVIQPRGVDTLRSRGWQFDNSAISGSIIAKELCFSYEYDWRQRIIIKRVPGAGEVLMVYDARDRLCMLQDSSLRESKKWLYTSYDALNRDTVTGLWLDSSYTRSGYQSLADASINYPNPNSNYEILKRQYYDDYTWVTGTGLSSTFINTYVSNTNYFYSESNSSFPYARSISPSYITQGFSTGAKLKVTGTTNTYIFVVNYYDDHGRVLQTQSSNYTGGKDTLTNQYDFTGNVIRSLFCHEKSGTNSRKYLLFTKKEFDPFGRPTRVSKKFGNSPEVIVSETSYDELGRIQVKRIGQKRDATNQNTYTSTPIDSLQYNYNVRGWLSAINKNFARANSFNNWFGEEIAYDYGFSQTQLNGNIAGIRWRSKGDGEQRAYGYTYDAVNRLSRADFTQFASSSWNTSSGLDFTVKDLSYDANGNILTMTQKGLKYMTSSVIDSLKYGYNANSNKLQYVTDLQNDSATKLGDFREFVNNTTQDYSYDGNGNIVADNNKKIGKILYNHLNLIDSIRINGKGTIKYFYEASGEKLKKVSIDSTGGSVKVSTILYLNGFEYLNDSLQFVSQEEGRIRPKSMSSTDTMYYDYFEKDHLSNVRIVLTDELKSDAYPNASMETAQSGIEETYYSRLSECRSTLPAGYPTDTYTSPNDYVARVRSAFEDYDVGPSIVLKVMAGDKFNVRVSSWWNSSLTPSSPNSPLWNLVSVMASSVAGMTDKFGSNSNIIDNQYLNSGLTDFLNTESGYNSSRPKAFINWVLLDEHFNFVSSSSGFEQVPAQSAYGGGKGGTYVYQHSRSNLPIDKNGYLFIFVSNETQNIPVYFDNLQVTHIRGPLLEESHYYPFGLIINGISSKTLNMGSPTNKKKFNGGSELNSDFDLNWYETQHRTYDPQIGRFNQVDELAESSWDNSEYVFSGNNPILFNDPFGLIKTRKETGLTPETAPILQGVIAWSISGGLWAKTRFYYRVFNQTNGHVERILNDNLRAMMLNIEGIVNHREKVAKSTREGDEITLEIASWFIPVGWITELRYVKYASTLLKFRRGTNILGKALTTVLGKYPNYLRAAEEMGFNAFNIEKNVWSKMTAVEQWAANTKFLDEAIARGDEIIFSHRVQSVALEEGAFRKELDYLIKKGYHLATDGTGMIK